MTPQIQRIALTPGEPAGIGPDLCIQIAQASFPAEIIAIADPGLLQERANYLDLPLEIKLFDNNCTQAVKLHQPGTLTVLPVQCATPPLCGQLDKQNAAYVLDTLRAAINGCLDKTFAAMVTGPVNKGIINKAGIPFTGHTEFLAELTKSPQVVMMLATQGLRVALVTTHVPLSKVSETITAAHLEKILHIVHHDLQRYFGIKAPRILVCGLNPHAGEDGHLGLEDRDIITPVINKLQQQGMHLQGPLPADTLFIPKYLDNADVVVAMYHDQGLPVLKHKGFGNAVNITLGLPLIRTSVDHGTALELAGTGQADTTSLKMAINTAIGMMNQRTMSN